MGERMSETEHEAPDDVDEAEPEPEPEPIPYTD